MSSGDIIATEFLIPKRNLRKICNEILTIHIAVYDLFPDIRTEKEKRASVRSGILYLDKGYTRVIQEDEGIQEKRRILIISDRQPRLGLKNVGKFKFKTVQKEFLQYSLYRFQVLVNPSLRRNRTRKIEALTDKQEVKEWFSERARKNWGFLCQDDDFFVKDITCQSFQKNFGASSENCRRTVTHNVACITGILRVEDFEKFQNSFRNGIGRGRAFGLGLLELVPLSK